MSNSSLLDLLHHVWPSGTAFARAPRGPARAVLVGLVACAILVGNGYRVSTASPLQSAPGLGAASTFAVLGASTVTNTGSSVVTGELGVSPGTAVTGVGPGVVHGGTIHSSDVLAGQAHDAATTAFTDLDQTCTGDLTGVDLGTLRLTPGVYCFESSAQLTGTLTLDAQGNADAVWVFKMGSTITTASYAHVDLVNNAAACNVFWRVGSSATLGTYTDFLGTIIAQAAITLTTGVNLAGRAFALVEAVTMDTNAVGGCTPSPAPATATPTSTLMPTATATPQATATSTPTLTSTAVPTATSTAVPTATSTPPTATATVLATLTPTTQPTTTPTATTTPTELPTPTMPPTATVGPGTPTSTPASTSTPIPPQRSPLR